MSIKKASKHLKHNKIGFTVLLNDTIGLIKDESALGIYCYLASKPEDWIICKVHLQNHFSRSQGFIKKIFKYLSKIGLIETKSIRDEKGKISHWDIILHDRPISSKPALIQDSIQKTEIRPSGENKKNNSFLSTSRGSDYHPVDSPPGGRMTTTKQGFLQNKETKKNKDVNDVSSTKSFNFEELRIRQLVLDKLGGKTLTLKQTKDLIKNHTKDVPIEKSLENCLYHMSRPSKKPILNPVACFLYHISTKGYFEDNQIYTRDKNSQEVNRQRLSEEKNSMMEPMGNFINNLSFNR